MANSLQGIGITSAGDTAQTVAVGVNSISERPSPTTPNAGASGPISDATDLSRLGNFIKSTTVVASAQSSFRQDLVASLQAQITAGDYHPDLNAVAARVAAALRA